MMPQFHSSKEFSFNYPCEDKTNCHCIEFSLSPGQYLLEVFGASNGFYSGYHESFGGYSRGILSLKETVNAFIFLGSSGIVKSSGSGNTGEAYNGGGSGSRSGSHLFVSSGGGATDIRLISPELSNRVIVAGGAGGHGHYTYHSKGGYGGGEYGGEGQNGFNGNTVNNGGLGGGSYPSDLEFFGKGENFIGSSTNACGGGGGWFGGRAGIAAAAGGGGGSGFIFTASNPYSTLPSHYYLKDASTYGGSYPFSRLGNGTALITLLEAEFFPSCHYFINLFNIFIPFLSQFYYQ